MRRNNKNHLVKSKGNTFFYEDKGIPKGCEYCLEGAKVVLFINGICQRPQHCRWYCPISKKRRGKKETYADEIQINTKRELLEEIEKIDAKGMSITGGEPLSKENIGETLAYIKFVKKEKGPRFHIHLYTNGMNFNDDIAQNLSVAGLDELRFHPPKEKWHIIKFALHRGMNVGVEVPLIPNQSYVQELEKNILYLDKIGADFVNLNEFEICFPNSEALKKRGFNIEINSIASVEESKEMALQLIEDLSNRVALKLHFCPIVAKDFYQLKNRYFRRAKNIKLPFEVVSQDGLLLYARVFGSIKDIKGLYDYLILEFELPKKLTVKKEMEIYLPIYVVLEEEFIQILKRFDLECEIVEKTPFRREKYYQITETTPLKVFKDSYEWS